MTLARGGWVDIGSNTIELQSRPSYQSTLSKEEIGVAVLFKAGRESMFARLSRGRVLGEEILILDLGRHPAKGEVNLPAGKARVLHNVVYTQSVSISENELTTLAGAVLGKKSKDTAAF